MKSIFLKFLTFCLLLLITIPTAKAYHIIGGEISYQCLGNNQYQITLKIYRDCFQTNGATFDNPAKVGIFNASGVLVQSLYMDNPQISPLSTSQSNFCRPPTNYCVELGVYMDTVTLPAISGGYDVVYQRCCRNTNIVNLNLPGAQGATYTTHIPGAPNHCNNSGVFQGSPIFTLFVLDTIVLNQIVLDADGDSIYYQFTNPFLGASTSAPQNPPLPPPFTPVNWAPGFDAANAVTSNPLLSIDQNTGVITGVPTQIGLYVVCISAFEYRNGVLLTENRREFVIYVSPCEPLSISENDLRSFFNIFPNPATEFITVEYELTKTSPVVVTITDINGKIISQEVRGNQMAGTHRFTQDVTTLAIGTYNMIIEAYGTQIAKQFIVQ